MSIPLNFICSLFEFNKTSIIGLDKELAPLLVLKFRKKLPPEELFLIFDHSLQN
jgi:hypothetical protein